MSSAEKLPGYLMYMQGGPGNFSEGANDTMTLTIHDVIPYSVLEAENRTNLIPMKKQFPFNLPADTALVLNGAGNESVFIVKTISGSFDPETNNLTLEIIPQDFYEGEGLKSFAEKKQDFPRDNVETYTKTAVYCWQAATLPENFNDPCYGYELISVEAYKLCRETL